MRYLLFLLLLLVIFSSCQDANLPPGTDQILTKKWEIQSSSSVKVPDSSVAMSSYQTQNWYPALVPGTVLGSLVADSVFTDVFFDRNLEKIPDSLFNVPWWYRTTFNVGENNRGAYYHLRLNGISYRADIWLNGHKVASRDTLAGSFRQFFINITPYIKSGKNILALKVWHAEKGDLNIGFVDWNPEPADHHMGIWRNIHLLISGPVSINRPFVQTDVDTVTLDHADLTISVRLQNHSDNEVKGILRGSIDSDISLSRQVTLAPHQQKTITFSPESYPDLSINHPKLWWTHTLGKPNLYPLHLEFEVNHQLSDSLSLRFGIRSVSGYMTQTGFRGYKLNGRKILIKGGGWTDPMLLNATPAYEKAGIDYAVHMNLNALRMEGFWGMNQHIYDLCDQEGILIMAGFSCQWEWANLMHVPDDQHGTINTPEKMRLAANCWRDQILWLRNHPSIFLWLYGSDKWPRPELEKKYIAVLNKIDPTRPYAQSAKEHVSRVTGPTGMKMRGPYDYVPPDYWYVDSSYGGAFGFNTETGPGPEIPVLESLKKMIPADSLWPISDSWLYHAARGKFHNLTAYNNAMGQRLGKPTDLKDYLRKAQYMNYEGMRAMYEAFESNRFKATGIIQWMYNSSWPKLWWQLYDYYLMPTGAFYGARKANEPLHISYNYGNHQVEVMNNTRQPTGPLSAKATIYSFQPPAKQDTINGFQKQWQKIAEVHSLKEQRTQTLFQIPDNLPLSKTWFLDLQLFDQEHHVLSTNLYALSTQKDLLEEHKSTWYITPQSQYADLTNLQQLPPVKLKTETKIKERDNNTYVYITVKNPTDHLAFMIHLNLIKKKSRASVTPIFWSENYFSLLPGEERKIKVYYHTADLGGEDPVLKISGWNIEKQTSQY